MRLFLVRMIHSLAESTRLERNNILDSRKICYTICYVNTFMYVTG